LGYVSGGLELGAQMASGELPRPDVVYVALGSNGTAAGLLVSLWSEPAIELVAVRVTDRVVASEHHVRRLAKATERFLGDRLGVGGVGLLPRRGQPPRLRVVHDQFGGAYGRPTAAGEAAVAAAAGAGLGLEPTYTGKCMAALLADARAGRLAGKRVLFIHTLSSVDLRPLLAGAPPTASLPPSLRRHFD
jgi:D-cysteine desulfhydrase